MYAQYTANQNQHSEKITELEPNNQGPPYLTQRHYIGIGPKLYHPDTH